MAKVGNYAGGLEADVVELEWIDADEPGAVFALLAGRRLLRGFLVRSLAALARGGGGRLEPLSKSRAGIKGAEPRSPELALQRLRCAAM